jgi:hypothetical protein
MERRDKLYYRYLAKTTSPSISISITYIVFVTKMQKRQIPGKGSASVEKRYHNQLKRCQNERYIAGICNAGIRTGMDDITGFLSL